MSIDPSFLESLMSIFVFFTPNGSLPDNYDPSVQLELMKRYIMPLLNVYNINNREKGIFVIKMVQGDA